MEIPSNIKDQIEEKIVYLRERTFPVTKDIQEPLDKSLRYAIEFGYNLASRSLSDLKAEIKILEEREVLWENKQAMLNDEIDRLKAWKEYSMSVTPDMQAIGKALGVKLGDSVHDKILPGIERLKDKLEAAKLALKEIYTGTDFPLSIAQNALQVLNKESITRD